MRLVLGFAGLACLAACVDNPAPPMTALNTPSAAPVATAKPADPAVQSATATSFEKKICKRMPVTGSMNSKRVCSTQAEWDAFDKTAKEGSDKFDAERKQGGGQIRSAQ